MAGEILTVKVVRMPGQVVEVVLEGRATIANALDAANMSLENGEKITLNGNAATLETAVCDGARVILSRDAKSA